jgi:hypothetical protein
MYGLEGQKGTKKSKADIKSFTFDLEEKLREGGATKALKDKVAGKLQDLKKMLQQGLEGEDFEKVGHLVYGYISLLKVVGRIPTKSRQ